MPHAPDAILLAAFGSRLPAAEASLAAMRRSAESLHPGFRVETALTSGTVRGHKAAQGGQARSPEDLLRQLLGEGVRRLAVQSLHVVPGNEYLSLKRLVEKFRALPDGFARLELGRPLLGDSGDIAPAARALLSVLPPERKPSEAVLLMGHGTRGRANEAYAELGRELKALDRLVLIGALEAEPGLEEKVAELKALGAGTVHLMPLLFARGKHAETDMAGRGEGSWRTGLERAGFQCRTHLRGAGEEPALAALWLDHLREAVARLSV